MNGYGIAIGSDGEVYDMGASGATKVRSDVAEAARKSLAKAQQNAKAMAARKAEAAKFAAKARAMSQAKSAQKATKSKASYADFRGLAEDAADMAMGNHMRNLPGIGDGLSGFGDEGETVISSFGSADFGSPGCQCGECDFGEGMGFGFGRGLRPIRKAARKGQLHGDCFGAEPGLGGAGKMAGDALEKLITKVISVRARIQQGDDAFYARMRKLPPSDSKAKAIAAYTKMATARESGAATKLYWTFANGVVTALESVDPKRASKLKMLFDNPWMTLKKTKTPTAALQSLSGDGLGLVPILLGVGVAGAVAGAGTAYVSQSSADLSAAEKEIKAQQESIAKDKKLLESKDVPESAKVELAKSIAKREESLTRQQEATTEARVEVAKEKAAAGPLGLGALTGNLKWIAIFGGAAVLAFMFLPQIKAMLPAGKQPVKQGG